MQNQAEYPDFKPTPEMSDAELIQHQDDVAGAGERLFAGVEVTPDYDIDGGLDPEAEDENGDLIEGVDGDYRSMDEYMADHIAAALAEVED